MYRDCMAPVKTQRRRGEAQRLGSAGRRPCPPAGSIQGRASRADHIGGGPEQRTGGPITYLHFARAASYVDRILRGEKPGDLRVHPTKFEMVVNLKTAKALGWPYPHRFCCARTR
jgi:hypothetical protein